MNGDRRSVRVGVGILRWKRVKSFKAQPQRIEEGSEMSDSVVEQELNGPQMSSRLMYKDPNLDHCNLLPSPKPTFAIKR